MRGSCSLNTKGQERGRIRAAERRSRSSRAACMLCFFCFPSHFPRTPPHHAGHIASPFMTSEVFNPNPKIIVTAGPSARRRAPQARHSLWLSDHEDSSTYDSDDEPEPIDADEIFGRIPLSALFDTARLKGFTFLLLPKI
jgi:hypothetical protein